MEPELVQAVAAAAALALENERLEAELKARVAELQVSRAKVIEVGMADLCRVIGSAPGRSGMAS